jgi:hypothetical protein
MENYPKITDVKPQEGKKLRVKFSNGIEKIYDCSPLLNDDVFKPLMNVALFNSVKADKHGYGVIWSDDLDLSESELWIHGYINKTQNCP